MVFPAPKLFLLALLVFSGFAVASARAHASTGQWCFANDGGPSSQSCTVPGGRGTQHCGYWPGHSGTTWGPCNVSSCSSGYEMKNGACVKKVTTPDPDPPVTKPQAQPKPPAKPVVTGCDPVAYPTKSCTVPNGEGMRRCEQVAKDFYEYGTCRPHSCIADHEIIGNVCVKIKPVLNQADSLDAVAAVAAAGSSISGSEGAVTLGEGIVMLETDPSNAGPKIVQGEKAIEAAVGLKKNEFAALANAGKPVPPQIVLSEDSDITGSDKAERVFSELEQRYGVGKEQFVSTVLGSPGDREAVDGLLSGISKEKLAQARAEGAEAQMDGQVELLGKEQKAGPASGISARAPASLPEDKNLRDTVNELLSNEEAAMEFYSSGGEKTGVSPGHSKGLAAAEKLFFSKPKVEQEFSLFEVVNQKYREKYFLLQRPAKPIKTPRK